MAAKTYAVASSFGESGYINENDPSNSYALVFGSYLTDSSVTDITFFGGDLPNDYLLQSTSGTGLGNYIPVQWLLKPGGGVGGDGGGTVGGFPKGIPVDWLTGNGGGGSLGGSGTGTNWDSLIPIYWLGFTSGGISLSGASGPISFIPVEWLTKSTIGTNATLNNIPVDWKISLQGNDNIQTDWETNLPLISATMTSVIPIDWKISIQGTDAIAITWLTTNAIGAGNIPVDWIRKIINTQSNLIPVEWDINNTYGTSFIPVEWATIALGDGGAGGIIDQNWHLQHTKTHLATNYPDHPVPRDLDRKNVKWNTDK